MSWHAVQSPDAENVERDGFEELHFARREVKGGVLETSADDSHGAAMAVRLLTWALSNIG